MIQKNYRAKHLGELAWNLTEITRLEEYRNARTVLAQVYIESWDKRKIRGILSLISAKLQRAVVVGMTNTNKEVYDSFSDTTKNKESVIIDLLCFESSTVQVEVYDTEEKCELAAGGKLGLLLKENAEAKGVNLFVAGVMTAIEDFITMATAENVEVPFFGSTAAVSRTKGEKDIESGCVFYGSQLVKKGFVAVILIGKDLHIRTGYNFGWTTIGKKMKVTKMKDEQLVCEIDGKPATYVYKKYLGLNHDQLTADNVCEFPFGVMRGSRLLARIGFKTDDPDAMIFSAPMYEEDEIQLTYGNPDIIFAESFADAMEVRRFQPQALSLIACMNRSILLKKDVEIEHDFYTPAAPEKMIVHGNSEVLFDAEGGGELNSALVSVAMREGDAPEETPEIRACNKANCPYEQKTIPLVRRMTTFLEATTHDLAEAVEQANAANAAKTQFLSSVSHEIRTPINAVLGMDEMILRESREPQIRHYAMDIQNSGRTLLSLINDLLDSSRIDSGKMEIIPVEYELSSMLNDLVNMTAVRANEKDLAFTVNVDSAIPHVLFGDDTRIKQCALNILTNAVKYTESGSVTMNVGFRKLDEEQIALSVSVKDTGIGIKEEDIDKLYVPYERIEEERNRGIEGTGLGMNIVLALLAMMDSKLDVESVYGEGSTFSFEITQKVEKWEPIGDFTEMYRRSVETTENYHETFRAPEARILVVDDTRMNLTVFKGLLKATEVQIDTAESGKEALSLVRKYSYDLIFLDQRMPGMDGIETLRRMKHLYDNKNHGVPVIMLTANAVAGAREKFLEEGFDDYLTKPINGKKLERAILERLPQEKVHIPTAEELALKQQDGAVNAQTGEAASDSAKKEYASPFLNGLAGIGSMSVEEGLTNCMNEEILRSTVHDFVVSAKSGPKEILEYLENEDIENYTIRVHALKSSARIIGAGALSEQAKHLEDCGDKKDMDEIREKTPKLLEDYRALAEALQDALDGKAVDPGETVQADGAEKAKGTEDGADGDRIDDTAFKDDRPELPEDQLKSAFNGVRELVEAFDFDGAADVLGMLAAYRLPQEVCDMVSAISDHITRLERDVILEKLKG